MKKAEEAVAMLPDGTNAPQFSWLPFRPGLRVSFVLDSIPSYYQVRCLLLLTEPPPPQQLFCQPTLGLMEI